MSSYETLFSAKHQTCGSPLTPMPVASKITTSVWWCPYCKLSIPMTVSDATKLLNARKKVFLKKG